MEIESRIVACREKYRISHMKVDGQYVCDVIEDKDRGLTQDMPLEEIKRKKIPAQTAIPRGRYQVVLNIRSPRFSQKDYYKNYCGGFLPRLLKVPGFDGVLMHRGVDQESSAGCLILGKNKVVGKVSESKECFEKVYGLMKDAVNRGEKIWITIC